jgi:deoxyribose-phosphate aldolase
MQPHELAGRIDHTILKAEATVAEVDGLIAEAKEHRFASVCVNGCFIAHVAKALRGSGVKTCGVVGFPLGAMKPSNKAMEAVSLAKDGADELDFVAHVPFLLARDLAAAKGEFLEIVKAARMTNPKIIIKVIVESACLLKGVSEDEGQERIAVACQAVRESGCDFIKTSTGFHGAGGATTLAVAWMKKHSQGISVKASGGIRSYADALAMLGAGADRLGCSAGVAIVQGAVGGAGY